MHDPGPNDFWRSIWGSRRVRTPTILQMEVVECGAAALAIVLAHYGRIVALEEVRTACGVSRDGSKASNMVRAAAAYGLEARAFSMEADELRLLPLPCVVFWQFNHFLVVEGFGRGVVYLNDPATGPRTVRDQEFDEAFTGVVLTFVPGPAFKRGGHKRSLIRALRRRLAGSEMALVYVALVGVALVIPGLVIPTFARVFVDEILVGGRRDWLGPLLLGLGLTAALRAGLVWLQRTYLMRLQAKLAVRTCSSFFWHVLRLPVEFFTQRYGGEIGSRVGINDSVAHLLSGELAGHIIDLLLVVFFAVLMFQYDVGLTLVGVGMALLNVLALRWFSRGRVDRSQRLQQEEGKLTGITMNGLQMIETIKATAREPDFFVRWSGQQSKVVNIRQRLALYDQYLDAVPRLLSATTAAIVLVVGGNLVMDGSMTIGMLVAFQSLMASFSGPFDSLVNLGATLQHVEGAMNRLDDVLWHRQAPHLGAPSEPSPPAGYPVKLSGRLEVRDVTFGYSRLDPPLIEGFSLSIKPGQRVALVGASGSGKSTLARLVSGLYEPWSGEVLFDGQPRHTYPSQILTNSLALVDQDIFLFEGTVSDNLTLWEDEIPEHEVVQAAKDACIHEDVVIRPGGYDSRVLEGGANFSGGQRQRLEIARALVGGPTLLVLDEATSALDPLTEQQIDENLRRRGCTCLIVAHRLSTIRDADEIIVLERGRIVQRGAHEALMSVEGPYADLIRSE
jgi:NHLM bacteriocin system ABC transporter peptidase/ATP-binding protein